MSSPATLIVGPSWVGDMVMAQALLLLLKQRDPERDLDILAPGWSLPIVSRMPQVRRGIAAQTEHGEIGLRKRWRISRELRRHGYDQAIILPRSLKAALIPWFASIERRTGFHGESRYILINDERLFDHNMLDQTVKRYVALGLEPGEALPEIPNPVLRVSVANQDALLDKLDIRGDRPVIAMMPGAEYGPAKCWPIEYFATLASLLATDGYDVWVLGAAGDADAGEQIAAQSTAVNLCGKTSLADVIDLLGLATQAVSNDSGLLHIAAAAGTHVHGIYGSSTPDFTPPLTARRDIHYLDIECSPCFERHCPLLHLRCLRDIQPATVHDAILARR
ncbi:MAG: lipopolysaccharide heptosyltransferase II [Proteobacteria bacterium]|nr:lipopolysaccharide heptosyltransferase II [Pseudomonadota bacterium]